MIISLVKNLFVNWNLQISRVAIQLRSRAKTKMSQSVTFPAILFPLRKAWKVYEIQATITGKPRRVPEGTWILG